MKVSDFLNTLSTISLISEMEPQEFSQYISEIREEKERADAAWEKFASERLCGMMCGNVPTKDAIYQYFNMMKYFACDGCDCGYNPPAMDYRLPCLESMVYGFDISGGIDFEWNLNGFVSDFLNKQKG